MSSGISISCENPIEEMKKRMYSSFMILFKKINY